MNEKTHDQREALYEATQHRAQLYNLERQEAQSRDGSYYFKHEQFGAWLAGIRSLSEMVALWDQYDLPICEKYEVTIGVKNGGEEFSVIKGWKEKNDGARNNG